jgi:hypothetical protein
MNLYKKILIYIVIFICVFFFSCERKGTSSSTSVTDTVPEVPVGTPVIMVTASLLPVSGRDWYIPVTVKHGLP